MPESKDSSATPEEVARQFACALDRDDFDLVARLLSNDCVYAARSGAIVGVASILASYREASAWAKDHLDSVRYESSVHPEPIGGLVSVSFFDHVCRIGTSHTYQCAQRLSVNQSGEIVRIEHVELPGQREALFSFLSSVGLSRA